MYTKVISQKVRTLGSIFTTALAITCFSMVQNKSEASIVVDPRIVFTSPIEDSTTNDRETSVSFSLKLTDPSLVNQDVKVSILIAQHDEYFNDPGADTVNFMDKGVFKTVSLPSPTQSINLTFDKVTLPYLGNNSIFCIYQRPNTTYGVQNCLREGANTLKESDLAINYISDLNTSYDLRPLYRFWSLEKQGHFYTKNEAEKYKIILDDPSWDYENIAYYVGDTNKSSQCLDTGKSEVYRFWNATSQHHFYTANKAEKDELIKNNKAWAYEGVAFCANKTTKEGLSPVYRFFSKERTAHFFTINKAEKDYLMANDPSWQYEDIAYYAVK